MDNRRVLIIDDDQEIWEAYLSVLGPKKETADSSLRKISRLLDDDTGSAPMTGTDFDLRFSSQGKEGFDLVRESLAHRMPFAVVFIDIRMPPGWNGMETAMQIRRIDPNVEIVIVTAYSDYSHPEIVRTVGAPDKLLILRKPFDSEEIAQLALSLTEKWNLSRKMELQADELRSANNRLRSFYTSLHNGWAFHRVVLDDNNNPVDYLFLEINDAFEKQTGLKRENVIGKRVTEVLPGIDNDPADWIGRFGKTAITGESIFFENYSEPLKKWYTVTASSPEPGYFIAVFEDISERKKIEEENKVLIAELQKALAEIKTLRGILPVCSFCKKIRDDKGYWKQIESYIIEHSEAEFSHGVCPDCMKEHYSEIKKIISTQKNIK